MPGPSWYGVTASQAGSGIFSSITAQPRSPLLVSTSTQYLLSDISTSSREAREALADVARCFFLLFFVLFFMLCDVLEKTNFIRDHVARYRIHRLLNLLEDDGNPSFFEGLQEFCFARWKQTIVQTKSGCQFCGLKITNLAFLGRSKVQTTSFDYFSTTYGRIDNTLLLISIRAQSEAEAAIRDGKDPGRKDFSRSTITAFSYESAYQVFQTFVLPPFSFSPFFWCNDFS